MREDISDWLFPELERVAKKHKYDSDKLTQKVMAIDGLFNLPQVRNMLNELLKGHHYELVGVLAELMIRDERVGFRKAGKTYQRRAAKAPPQPEPLLRMLDRAVRGLRLFRAKVEVKNPWKIGEETETLILKLFAASIEDAIAKATIEGEYQPAVRVLDVKVREITSDEDEAEAFKADVETITLRRDAPLLQTTVPSFEAATAVLRDWQAQTRIGDDPVGATVRIEWENGENCTNIVWLSASHVGRIVDVSALLKATIALILDGVPLPDRSARTSAELRESWIAQGGESHMCRLRAQCMLRDRHPILAIQPEMRD